MFSNSPITHFTGQLLSLLIIQAMHACIHYTKSVRFFVSLLRLSLLRSLLGLDPAAMSYLSTLQVTDLIKLVYRDHIQLKHGSRKRLAAEVSRNTKRLQDSQKNPNQREDEAVEDMESTVDPMSKMLVKYMMVVTRPSAKCLHVLFWCSGWGPGNLDPCLLVTS